MDSLMQAAMTRAQRSREGGMTPSSVYGLKVPAGDIMIPANSSLPLSFRITMAAIDPSASASTRESGDDSRPRATLKLVKERSNMEDYMDGYYSDEDEDEDDEDMEDDEDDEKLQKLLKAAKDMNEDMDLDEDDNEDEDGEEDDDDTLETMSKPVSKGAKKSDANKKGAKSQVNGEAGKTVANGMNGMNGTKGKKNKENGKTEHKVNEDSDEESDEQSADDDDDDDDDSAFGLEEFVLCTLDPEKNYQHPLDIYIGNVDEADQVFFKVSGTHDVYLTGNYLEHQSADNYSDLMDMEDEDEEDDISEDDLDDEDEEDELDGLADPRITEVHSAEASPEPSKATVQKGKNKRPAEEVEDESPSLDNMINKSLNSENGGEQKLSKKQLKKMKNNAGNAVAAGAAEDKTGANNAPKSKDDINGKAGKGDKKVQFAKDLEQGPTGSPQADAKATSKKEDKSKPSLGVKMVQGVKVDDKKLGEGPQAKKGDKVAMRYIGKLEDGKVFDANKKGKPFTFKLGSGEVIKGWDIGVAGMSRGGERRINIPASLGYGSKGMPGIPANSNLVFDIKMISIN